MKRLKDTYDMLRKGVNNLENVVSSNINYYKDVFGALPEHQKDEAQRRLAICTNCPFNSKNRWWTDTQGNEHTHYNTTREDEHCTACGCPIEKKIFSFNEKCGLSYITELRTFKGKDENGNEIVQLTSSHDNRAEYPLVYNWQPLWEEYNTETK